MPFVKLIKNSAFFSRYQVQYRRRREGKTDYYARKRLIIQDKDKYNSPKFRLVARFTNTDIICQIIYSKINGDVVMTAAYAHELTRYGVPVGHTNYASAYATGLLLARRHLSKLGLASKYIGKEKADGAEFKVTPIEDGPRPFLAFLDVGLARTTTGAKVFAALKGAVDGGLNVPHCEKRFFGYDPSKKASNPAKLRKAILGGVVSDYMLSLSKSNPSKFKKQFSRYIKNGLTADKIEGMYIKAHAQIRESPARVAAKKEATTAAKKDYRRAKLTKQQKKDAIAKKLALRNRINKKKAQKN